MGLTMLIIQIVISIILPVWLCVWCSKQIKRQIPPRSGLRFNIPDIHYLLKHWWAQWCIASREETNKPGLGTYSKYYVGNTRIIKDEDNCNSVLFYGTDQKGNSLFIKFVRRRHRAAEILLQLVTSDGRLYVLPGYPDMVVTRSLNQEWSANGLKIELLEFQQRWRITYNGMLRNLAQGDELSDENIEHIRLNFIFVHGSQSLNWPDDWSSKLHADALAREPWKSPEWKNKIKLMNYAGFDQYGSVIGQVTFKDSSVSTLYLRGLCQCRWGKHESHEFHETVTMFGVFSTGPMYCLGASSTKHSFSRMQFGHFKHANERISQIDWTSLELADFTEEKSNSNSKRKIWFTAGDTEHNVVVKLDDPKTFYCGRPWNWTNKIVNLKLELNGKTGVGLMQLWYPYTGPCQTKQPMKIQYLKTPNTCIDRNDYVVFFNDGKCQNENIVGGKGFSLAVLTSIKDADFNVPEGFCVTVFALELQLQTCRELQRVIDDVEDISTGKKDGDLKKYCEEAIRVIQSTPVVEPVRVAILEAIENIESSFPNENNESQRYAIRSSAVGEDSEETSAAGQNSTYLGVTGADNIIKSVAMCWASLFSYQSVEYRKQHGLLAKASMGVCVQRMVNAEAAGVMFTRHPTTGDPSNIMITANYGLGESVVSAMVEPDTIIVYRSWDDKLTMKSSILGNKTQKISMTEDGVATTPVDQQEIQEVCISDKTAVRLARIGVHVETLFGSPRDIEWAVIDDKMFLLQARPITTLNTWTDFELTHELDSGVPSDTDIMTLANVGEVFPNPMSPLSISIVLRAFNTSIGSQQFHTKGHCCSYLHVTAMRCTMNYYQSLLREAGEEITIFNKTVDIAICGNVVITPEIHKIALERNGHISRQHKLFRFYTMISEAWNNSAVEMEARKLYENLILNADDFDTAYSLYKDIDKKLKEIDKITTCHTFTSRVSTLYQVLAMSLLTKGYEDFVPDHFSDIAILLSSCSDVVSSEVPIILDRIASCIRESGKAEEFRKTNPKEGIKWLKENCPPAAEQLEILLKEHGHRCIQELDLFSEPWSLKPESLIVSIQPLTTSSKSNPTKKLSVEETVAALKTPKSKFVKWFLKKIIPFCREAVTCREMTKALMVNMVHKFKLAYRRLGVLMVSEGYLPSESLVFFLTHQEIGQMLKNRNPTLVQKAHRRRKLHSRLGENQYADYTTGMPVPIKTNLDTEIRDECMKVQGTAVCAGSVLARACVITNISDAKEIQYGDILITHSTDIGWSPYFPLLSGIVTELGGLISHGAVVAREYGLPCIVGAKAATQVFRTGDTVLLAADAGLLQMVKKS